MDWKKYFNSTILSRGRQYYHEGRVKRLTHRDHEWFAAVKGSRSYNVIAQMGEDGDIEDMECSCLYAYNGRIANIWRRFCMRWKQIKRKMVFRQN